PRRVDAEKARDRLLIFEDTDGDGHFDTRKIFADKLNLVSGFEIGFGGVWVCATPDFLFIPDRDGDDKPDGEPVVKLDGWDIGAKHNVFNALRWGPDGWLYGCNGILSNSKVGKPGASDDERVALNCGVWRYHPTREKFEWVASGTTNPWGLDFNDVGEMFITNCVIPHLFHVTPGAHFQRMFGQDLNPHVYGLIESCADHIHWGGGAWTESRGGKGKHSEAGGGHAHAGAMIYLADNWPKEYRGEIFMCNIHGHRVNHDTLERRGSGYVAHHSPDFFLSTDEWFRGLEMKYGPDGAVYLTDWSDTGECHEFDAHGAHHNSGRIFKISFGTAGPVDVDLARTASEELAKMHLHANDWYVRQARLQLQMRAAAGKDVKAAVKVLRDILKDHDEMPRRLRALWTLYAIGQLTEADLAQQLDHADETQRVWGVRLLCDQKAPSDAVIERFAKMSRDDRSQAVRLALASALQKLPPEQRWSIVEGLAGHAEDATDANLPLMIWYGMEPLVGADRARAVSLSGKCQIPVLRQYIARRAVSK
ncbi:MAG TPA: PVC-type heme-binding CxxCH protein, partial [Planctomycetaceae bacterium]|nr:PVC-type heme-binding CxxCH protein [Planctomycetaceae bacterium]